MTDEPDVTERHEQVLRALMAEKLAADIDSTEVGGPANDELAQQLVVSEEEIRHDIQALSDLGCIQYEPAVSPAEDSWFRQVQCDWQWPDGRYCNMTVHFYALYAARTGKASLAGYCCLEHANASPHPTLVGAQQLYGEMAEGVEWGHCDAAFNAKLLRKLIDDAYPDPITVTDVDDKEND